MKKIDSLGLRRSHGSDWVSSKSEIRQCIHWTSI